MQALALVHWGGPWVSQRVWAAFTYAQLDHGELKRGGWHQSLHTCAPRP